MESDVGDGEGRPFGSVTSRSTSFALAPPLDCSSCQQISSRWFPVGTLSDVVNGRDQQGRSCDLVVWEGSGDEEDGDVEGIILEEETRFIRHTTINNDRSSQTHHSAYCLVEVDGGREIREDKLGVRGIRWTVDDDPRQSGQIPKLRSGSNMRRYRHRNDRGRQHRTRRTC